MKLPLIAVFTGDVVDSSKLPLPARNEMLDRLERTIAALGAREQPSRVLDQQAFRGDAFQVALQEPSRCLDDALELQLAIQESGQPGGSSAELRIGIGIGALDWTGNATSIGRWSGSAFIHAADALKGLEGMGARRLAIMTPWPEANEEFAVQMALLDALRRRWTSDQRSAILGALQGRSQAEQAAALGVSQPAVSQRLRSAGWDALTSLRVRVSERIEAGLSGSLYEEGEP